MKTKVIIALVAALALLLVACGGQSIEDIKNEDHIGKQVAISGTVTGVIKLGPLSAYSLEDKNGDTIGVAADELPSEGDKVTARGTLVKDTLLGYYIQS